MKWLRLWTDILDDPKMCQLADDEYRVFTYLLAMAAEGEKDGAIPFTPGDIAWRTRLPVELITRSMDKLLQLDIIGPNGNGWKFVHWNKRQYKSDNVIERVREWRSSKKDETLHETLPVTLHETLDVTAQNRAEQNRTDTISSLSETDTPSSNHRKAHSPLCGSNNKCPHEAILKFYHETLPELKSVKVWSEERKKQLQARWNEEPKRQNLEWWQKYFSYIRDSDFLMGKNDKHWSPNLEWLVKKGNLINVIEGKYHKG